MIGSNVSPLHPKKHPHVTHTATVFLKSEKSEENVAKNKTVTTVIQYVCSTCLDFLVLLTIKCTRATVNLKCKKAKSHYVGEEGKKEWREEEVK